MLMCQLFDAFEMYFDYNKTSLAIQVIAGIVEHRISDQFSDQTFFVNMLSFVARTINSYWGTQVRC